MIVSGSSAHSICQLQSPLTHEVGDVPSRTQQVTITCALIIITIRQITLRLRTHRALKGQLISNSLARSQLPALFNYPIIRWRSAWTMRRVESRSSPVHRNNNTIKHGNPATVLFGIILESKLICRYGNMELKVKLTGSEKPDNP